jgi:hypothetical protein
MVRAFGVEAFARGEQLHRGQHLRARRLPGCVQVDQYGFHVARGSDHVLAHVPQHLHFVFQFHC